MFSSYASMMGYIMIIKPMINTIIPRPVQNFVFSYLKSFAGSRSSTLTLTIDQLSSMYIPEELYDAAQAYLSTKISPNSVRLIMARDPAEKKVKLYHSHGEVVSDVYNGIKLEWRFSASNKNNTMAEEYGQSYQGDFQREYLELSFDKKHRDLVVNSYIPYVESEAKVVNNNRRILNMHSYSHVTQKWQSVNFEHPSTFNTMAMNDDLKRSVIEDLDRFVGRKDFYKRVGKAWKRGYLLYGPPGTGKSSLVAAMANYLKFDIYDLQLASVQGDAHLRSLLLGTKNSSILLVEDIDCSVDLPTRLQPETETTLPLGAFQVSTPLTLSGLLNCIDGLWSSCGNERIIIFTTNNKEKLDPALLRPGRMDMHIYMGHCSFEGFKTLASNYLGLSDENDDTHPLYPDIKHLIDGQVLTPAQVAEELMKDEDADAALEGLVKVLKRKRSEPEKCDDESKMKKLKEGEKIIADAEEAIADAEETLRELEVLTPAQVEDKEELVDSQYAHVMPALLSGPRLMAQSGFPGFYRGGRGIGPGFRGRGMGFRRM
ncbi:P-loop containing nucleoside triphosphate hydrolase [Arabidopsis thaliana x Arabidopsis arenosa]|uniref:P-loop containing nucleoside triphosphate hydrolase n=1 Tax=Arabidopsis thaliana x Arabidopsis arenosa TaxID=1240361 RepID=A0A8T1YY89_9BRAS|nr:P-loop containing nucleoside triphosphate hydrolase [Arabidopsis thaliana x Arabidopsis arenosa]